MIKLTTKQGIVMEIDNVEEAANLLKQIGKLINADTERVKIPVRTSDIIKRKKKGTYAFWSQEEKTLINELVKQGQTDGEVSKNAFLRQRHSRTAILAKTYASRQEARKLYQD